MTTSTDPLAEFAIEDRDIVRKLADTGAVVLAEVILPSGRRIGADDLNAALEAQREATTAHTPPAPGEFCHRHFSWLCQAGQGKCQAVADAARAEGTR